jgi:hypothetical protein
MANNIANHPAILWSMTYIEQGSNRWFATVVIEALRLR